MVQALAAPTTEYSTKRRHTYLYLVYQANPPYPGHPYWDAHEKMLGSTWQQEADTLPASVVAYGYYAAGSKREAIRLAKQQIPGTPLLVHV